MTYSCHNIGLWLLYLGCRYMPKLKTKSSVKKRFKIRPSGAVVVTQSGKQHGMIKRSKRALRNLRGRKDITGAKAVLIKLYAPYGIN